MFYKLKKNRQYQYTPRFYNPEEERKTTGRRPIQFRRGGQKTSSRSLILGAITIGVLIYMMHLLSNMGQ